MTGGINTNKKKSRDPNNVCHGINLRALFPFYTHFYDADLYPLVCQSVFSWIGIGHVFWLNYNSFLRHFRDCCQTSLIDFQFIDH